MSYRSYTSFSCTFPADTKIANPTLYDIRLIPDKGIKVIEWDDETRYAEGILYDLNRTFGKRLDEVPGLTLDLHYSTDEDEHWEFYLGLENGEWSYQESEIVFRSRPVDESYVDLDAGTPLGIAKEALRQIQNNVGVVDGRITRALSPYMSGLSRWYDAGTSVADILRDIEEETGVDVSNLVA